MPVPGVGHLLIGIAAALLAISVLVPPLMQSLGRTRIRSHPVQGPDAVRPAGNDPQYRKLFDQFAALGFEPAGTEVQLGWFLNPWIDLAYAVGIVSVLHRFLRDVVVMPQVRKNILASHSDPRR
jgi:hypothetical protein